VRRNNRIEIRLVLLVPEPLTLLYRCMGTDRADYTQSAEKTYKLNLKGLKPDLEAYQKAKEEALSQGQLVETENGDVIAVDEDRRFFADANSLGITDHKPSKEAIDRLAEGTKKRYVLSPCTFLIFF